MKNHFRLAMLIIGAFVLTNVFAQAQMTSADSTKLNPIARKVQRYFNQNQPDSIRAMTDDSFRLHVSLGMMKGQTNEMLNKMGQWKSLKFEEVKDGIARYTATFDKATWDFYLGLNADGKANTIAFKPKD